MNRLVQAAFVVLVLATVGAFFVTQHLKSSRPVVVGVHQTSAFSPALRHRAKISFYLRRADSVSVYVVSPEGDIVRQLAGGREIPKLRRVTFYWNGREDGQRIAPDGIYRFRVALAGQGRTLDLEPGVRLDSQPPRPVVTSVDPGTPGGPALFPQRGVDALRIHLRGTGGRPAKLVIYRTDVPGSPAVAQLAIPARARTVDWNGQIDGAPAPAGTYLMGLDEVDRAGNFGTFPSVLPPTPGAVSGHAGVTIRYLAAEPPLDPVAAGSAALVDVDARGRRYEWALRPLGGGSRVLRGAGRSAQLRLRLPRRLTPGIYALAIVAAGHRTEVPLVVRGRSGSRILVVIPSIGWQGSNPVDDDGDGIPNTLANGGPVALARVFARGLPAGIATHEQALIAHLHASHLHFELTTDLALADGAGPAIGGHSGVVLAGEERWLPGTVAGRLRRFVRGGGILVSIGADSLRRTVALRGGRLVAPSPPASTDALGGRIGAPVRGSSEIVSSWLDEVGLFRGTSGIFPGFSRFTPVTGVAPPAQLVAAAGPAQGVGAIASWRLGSGRVVRIGLPDWEPHLTDDPDAQQLTDRLWALLGR